MHRARTLRPSMPVADKKDNVSDWTVTRKEQTDRESHGINDSRLDDFGSREYSPSDSIRTRHGVGAKFSLLVDLPLLGGEVQ